MIRVQEHVPLAPFTTFKIGGAARYFVTARTLDDIREAVTFGHERSLPLFVLGGGSNILIADEGFPGLVLQPVIGGITFEEKDGRIYVTAGAGVSWDTLVQETVGKRYAGFECLSGIPGTVGGAVVANLGAYGAEISEHLVRADVLDTEDISNNVTTFTNEQCTFSYHHSFFGLIPGRYVIVCATFALDPHGVPTLSYRDSRFNIATLTTELGRPPTLQDVRRAVLKIRAEKGVLEDSYRSAGSFFHMPYVSPATYERIEARARAQDSEKEKRLRPWAWQQSDGSYKIAPGFLLEYTEFQKGYIRGPVGISPKHTLSVITSAGACARDVARFAREMQDAVQTLFGISLEREVKYVGNIAV